MDVSQGTAQDGAKQRNGRRASRMELLQESLETGRRRSIMPLPDLEVIWKTMDINGDGLITYDEFCSSLKRISNEPISDGAITNILKEIDVDGSGLIDHMEFMDFFSRLEDMDYLDARLRFQGFFCSYFVVFYTVFSIIILVYFVLKEIDYRKEENNGVKVDKQSKTLIKFGRNICIVNLSFSVFWAILLPVLRLKGPECISACRGFYDYMEFGNLRKRRRKRGAARISAAPMVTPAPPSNGWQDMPSPAAPRLEAAACSQENTAPPRPPELPAVATQEVSYRTPPTCRKRPHSAPALGRERTRDSEVAYNRPVRPGTATGSRETPSAELSRPMSASSSREARSAEVCSPVSSMPAARPPTPTRTNASPAPPREPPPVLMMSKAKASHYDPARFAHARHLQEDEAGRVAPQFNPLTAMQTHSPIKVDQQVPRDQVRHELSHSTWGTQLEPPVRAGRPLVTYLD